MADTAIDLEKISSTLDEIRKRYPKTSGEWIHKPVEKKDGGKGSGNFGHKGRPGEVGGSSGSGSSSSSESKKSESTGSKKKYESATEAAKDHTLPKHRSAEAQKAYDKARNAEPKITKDMVDIADELGNKMFGLPYSVKTASSVEDKIQRKMKNDPSAKDHEIVGAMGDLVRYTQMTEHDKIADTTERVIDTLSKKGYDIIEVDNKYLNPASDYKGVHVNAISPDGQKFELQIHSEQSMKVKDTIHPMYEKSRNVNTPKDEADAIRAKMKEISSTLPMPKGIERIKGFKK